jgi:arginine-tRNA-protein transferase
MTTDMDCQRLTRKPHDNPQFYLTAPSSCPYLPDRVERKVFTHVVGERATSLNNTLTHAGFRRSQNIAYRPACEGCSACVSVRTQDIIGIEQPPQATSEQYALFRQYLDERHADGGMADMSVADFSLMIGDTHVNTMIVEYRLRDVDSGITGRSRGALLASVLVDVLEDGLSLVYSFYDTQASPQRSLGTYIILDQINRARKHGLPYLYLGYWVNGSPKMHYKTRFLPQEHLMSGGWITYHPHAMRSEPQRLKA